MIYVYVLVGWLRHLHQVLQRSHDAILALELLTMLNEGIDVNNMMGGSFDFKQFQVASYNIQMLVKSL